MISVFDKESGANNMDYRLGEEAVSPVIGVILMVALTVILAAIVAAFVFGLADEIRDTKIIAATDHQTDGNHIVVTYRGGQDAGTCVGMVWTVTPESGSLQVHTMGSISPTASALTVGSGYTFTGSFGGKDHVVATAYFDDSSQQVVLDHTL